MPANLDDSTKRIVVLVSSFTTLAIAIPALYAQFVMIQNFRRQLSNSGLVIRKSNPSLFTGCLACVALMTVATIVTTLPIVVSESERPQEPQLLSSSINFCEEDFQNSAYIAEPANTISSLTCYIPLALFGLLSRRTNQHRRAKRFVVMYSSLFAIGVGSMALHSLLTSGAQGGDELPMLWFTAAAAFCALDIIVQTRKKTTWLVVLVTVSAVAATATYVGGRHNFTIFYILFSLYSQTMVFSIIYITFGIDWETKDRERGIEFKANVLFPLAIATGWSTILAIWVWVSEMLFCNAVMQDRAFGKVVAPFVWNRVLHPMWHFWSGLLAWLLIQALVAAHGMQQDWGTPVIEWFGTPHVVFQSDSKKIP